MSPIRPVYQITTQDVLVLPLTFSQLTSATFAASVLTSNLWIITSPPLNLIFFSSPKHRFVWTLTAAPSLFPHTISILVFNPKLAAVCMCAVTFLALVLPALNLPNFPPSGLDFNVTLLLNSSVLYIFHLTPLTM